MDWLWERIGVADSWRPNMLSFLLPALLLTGIAASGQQAPGGVPQGDNSLLSDGQLHVVLCGTGSPILDATRASACVAVLAGGEFVLIDTGPGSWRKVASNNLPTQAVSAILLTHFHSDHIGDLGETLMQTWAAGRGKPLDVYGPPGVEGVVAGFERAYARDTDYRVAHHGEPTMPRAAAGAVARPVILKTQTEAATVFERNGLKVTAFKVEHDPATPAYGYRLEYRGRAVVITGDTLKSANVAKYATGADLLIHDVLARDLLLFTATGLEKTNPRRAKLLRDISNYHASPREAGEVAAAAKVDTLILTHMVPPPNNSTIEQSFLRGVGEVFSGKVVIAKDGLRFDLTSRN
jgi:ribonuclease Z